MGSITLEDNMDFKKLLDGMDNCECGMQHHCPMDYVIIEHDALKKLPGICREYQNILLVCDNNTFNVCGQETANILGTKIENSIVFNAGKNPLIPNEASIKTIDEKTTEKTDLILGVGSGVINDLCKHVSFKHNLPYFIVATAPSMDGYASSGSALILKGMKVTLNAASPKAIIADTAVLKDAPTEMIIAGYGDIIGKYSCLNDWKLSAIVNDEYFCQTVYSFTYEMAEQVKKLAKALLLRDEEAVGALMEALVAVGIAMAYVGTSRPASGSEHHLSHFFEITGILSQKPYFVHGIDVAYSAVVTAKLREKILMLTPDRKQFDEKLWEKEIKRIYLGSAEEIIKFQQKAGWYYKDNSQKVLENWEEIKKLLQSAPSEHEMIEMLDAVGLEYDSFVDMYGLEKINDGVMYGKDLKDRYSVLWLYYEFFR